ncbi:hypothetical protein FRC02_000227 [Tulasnella sp. 418]|nr:hypothetical protein FRC02_000227 [Tulasnella sp. 418]
MEYLKDFMHLQRDKHGGEQSSGQPLDSASHSASPIKTIKNSSIFWDHYVKEADLYDTEMVKGIAGDLDTLLIFVRAILCALRLIHRSHQLCTDLRQVYSLLSTPPS